MKIVGCDFHPRWQQIAVFDVETGEISEHNLGEVSRFDHSAQVASYLGLIPREHSSGGSAAAAGRHQRAGQLLAGAPGRKSNRPMS